MAVLYNVFGGLCHLTIYIFFWITVNTWDNKGTNGPAIITYCENWPLIPALWFLLLTNHLFMWKPLLLFLTVLNPGSTSYHSLPASVQKTIGSFNRNSKGYFSPGFGFSPINCMLLLVTMYVWDTQLRQEQNLPYAALKRLKTPRHLNWKLWNWTKLCISFVTSKGTACSE